MALSRSRAALLLKKNSAKVAQCGKLEEERAIEKAEAEKWQPLNREQAWTARDLSHAGETFVDYNGLVNEILYSILTPLGYQAHVSAQELRHLEKHPIAVKHLNEIPHILNNPDLITPNPEEPETHLFYKAFYGKLLLALPVHLKGEIRFLASMYKAPYIKGLKQKRMTPNQFLYLRGGFQWKKWK
ncbi:MAG: hypothetical protein AAB354_08635 [candidate division KSB1 bacterium]